MNSPLVAAAILAFMLGAAHSALGEICLLRHLGNARGIAAIAPYVLVPIRALAGSELLSRQTIRMAWHALTVLGWSIASILVLLSVRPLDPTGTAAVRIISVAFAVCAMLFLVGTRLRHPAGLAFVALALLSWLGASG